MQIICPQCSKALDDRHINTAINIVTCDTCDAVFSTPNTRVGAIDKKKLDDVGIPKRFVIDKSFDSLTISYKHNACMGIMTGIFALIWNGMLWSIFVPTFLFGGITSFAEGDLEAILFPLFLIPFILVGLFVAYQALFQLLNTTTVNATRKNLTIQHRPLSIPFDKTIETASLRQLFTKRKVTSGSGGDTITYDVYMVKTDGKQKKLLQGFPEAQQAIYLEREIEAFLGIEDRYVEGQYE